VSTEEFYAKDIRAQLSTFDADIEAIRNCPSSKRAHILVENLKNKLSNAKSQKSMH
jgi:hypothetical protein